MLVKNSPVMSFAWPFKDKAAFKKFFKDCGLTETKNNFTTWEDYIDNLYMSQSFVTLLDMLLRTALEQDQRVFSVHIKTV